MSDRGSNLLRIVGVILLAGFVYLIGNEAVPLWDRDEPRYAQTSRQMLRSGDWVVPMFLDQPRVKKPPMIYWCQATAMRFLGDNVFAARLPSTLAIVLLLVLMTLALSREMGTRRTFWTVLILASSALVILAAKMCITDALLLLFITASQLCLYAIYRGRWDWPIVLATGVSVGLAGLTKGPIVLGVMGTTLLVLLLIKWIDHVRRPIGYDNALPLENRTKPSPIILTLKLVVIVALVAAIVGPWLYMMEQRDPGYTLRILNNEVVERAGKAQEGHAGPPGYYLITVWGTYFPWSLLLPLAVIYAWRHRSVPIIRFSLAAVIGPWLMLEIVKTKLPHYLLPIFPFMAILTADAIVRCMHKTTGDLHDRGWSRIVFAWSFLLTVLVGVATTLAIRTGFAPTEPTLACAAFAILSTLVTAWMYHKGKVAVGSLRLGIGMLAGVGLVFLVLLPRASGLDLSRRVGTDLRQQGATEDVVMIDYKEPSLAFYQGGSIRESDGFHKDRPLPQWVSITRDAFDPLPDPIKEAYEITSTHEGVAYADEGRHVEVLILKRN